ncbi:hypothetical protein [Sphingopyxis sp.]|uniref:hypothetical protein n=1 Tax=Sphingopyxis sp. TaxID=1908224 RepID=UPI001DCC0454|nr:hypothetical protein [Sphingopyxis sp.]MBW8297937.1 hypothetical protein [Sphingopyxis sp.]
MNRKWMASTAAAVLLGIFPAAANAQHGSGAGTNSPIPPAPRGDLDRTRDRLCAPGDICDQDRDRIRDKDRTDMDRDQDRLRDKDRTGDMDQDRDRLNSSQAIDDQLARFSLLTSAERMQFRDEMRAATTAEERERIRARHQEAIEARAREMGIDAPPRIGRGADYGNRSGYMLMTMLTDQERAGFRSRMQAAATEQERQRIRNELRVTAQQRARELGVEVPEWYGRGTDSR